MNKTISATFAMTAMLVLAGVVGITIIKQWAQAEAAYQIEEIKISVAVPYHQENHFMVYLYQ